MSVGDEFPWRLIMVAITLPCTCYTSSTIRFIITPYYRNATTMENRKYLNGGGYLAEEDSNTDNKLTD